MGGLLLREQFGHCNVVLLFSFSLRHSTDVNLLPLHTANPPPFNLSLPRKRCMHLPPNNTPRPYISGSSRLQSHRNQRRKFLQSCNEHEQTVMNSFDHFPRSLRRVQLIFDTFPTNRSSQMQVQRGVQSIVNMSGSKRMGRFPRIPTRTPWHWRMRVTIIC